MGRGLPQEVIEKAKQEVSLDDRFCFECKRCGQCCFRCEIVLTPYDILRLCHGLSITTGEFLILSAPATSLHPPYDQGSDAEPHQDPHRPETVEQRKRGPTHQGRNHQHPLLLVRGRRPLAGEARDAAFQHLHFERRHFGASPLFEKV